MLFFRDTVCMDRDCWNIIFDIIGDFNSKSLARACRFLCRIYRSRFHDIRLHKYYFSHPCKPMLIVWSNVRSISIFEPNTPGQTATRVRNLKWFLHNNSAFPVLKSVHLHISPWDYAHYWDGYNSAILKIKIMR